VPVREQGKGGSNRALAQEVAEPGIPGQVPNGCVACRSVSSKGPFVSRASFTGEATAGALRLASIAPYGTLRAGTRMRCRAIPVGDAWATIQPGGTP